ncbi:protein phosphatase 2C domain-containing protein [Glycomyces sp. A-F 0318]|uniref:protein phosphatase 2C domain-containing protein n=1 Tax=Glycomyces amatae TaxID=2881355 RepID=UPI001E5824AC|nr:protein phosphatase 2C domain-containing protein [Glycomyces amatae]MCD0444648.1 protein phosphatase 2C domain-containing protein [Glycomyces amatae]
MTIRISADSAPGGAGPNEDHYRTGDAWALVLDGITRYPDDGCVHDVPWYVERLGAAIAARIGDRALGLRAVLGGAIEATADGHRGCDLANPVTPGATVAMVRLSAGRLAWLVLGDSAVAWRDGGGAVRAVSDERLARLTGAPAVEDVGGYRRYPVGYIAAVRNRPHGFWVASADPGAAAEALTGEVDAAGLRDAMLCTDGLTRLTERYGHRWEHLLDRAGREGVAALCALVREHERGDPVAMASAKPHDDATGVHLGFR